MKLTASEFISKAEGLKSSEMNVRQRLESIRSHRQSVQNAIATQQYRLQSLYLALEALESEESGDNEDGEGTDNSAEIAAVMAEISSTQESIEEYEQQDAELRSEEMEANSELRSIGLQEQETLAEIQDSAARTNQNIALISSFGGDYANVSAQATGSFRHNLGQLSQAAQILGGNVAMGASGAGGGSSKGGSISGSGSSGGTGSGRNFYETANNQRKTDAPSSGSMGTRGGGASSIGRKWKSLYGLESISKEEEKPKKNGGFGRKPINQILDKPGVCIQKPELNFQGFANSNEKQQMIRNYAIKWRKELSTDEVNALTDYTREEPNYYRNINQKLRGKTLFFDEGNRERATMIHNALKKSKVPCACTVYRGGPPDILGKYKNIPDNELVGKVLLDKGFMSTSTVKGSEFGGSVKLEIFVPVGAKGAYLSDGISAVGECEHEMLFDKGCRMKIVGVKYDMWHNRVIQARMM